MAKKDAPIVLRTITAGNAEKGFFRAQLLAEGNNTRVILIEKQSQKNLEIESEETVIKQIKTIVVYPDYEGLNKADSEKRGEEVAAYIEKNGVAKALTEVGKEVVKANKKSVPAEATAEEKEAIKEHNKNLSETVITWQPQIEKDLGYPVKTRYENVPKEETVISISNEIEYSYKKEHSNELYYRIKPRDFVKYVHNFLNDNL